MNRKPVARRCEPPLATDGQVGDDPVGPVVDQAAGAPGGGIAVLILDEEIEQCLVFNADRVRARLVSDGVSGDSARVKESVATFANIGADELILSPATGDIDDISRLAEIVLLGRVSGRPYRPGR